MNRRTIMAAAIAGFAPVPVVAEGRKLAGTLQRLIDEVVAAGDTSGLAEIVTNDVTLPDMDVDGIDAFRAASDAGHASRQARYSAYAFNVMSVVESDAWAHALVRFEGTTNAGQTERRHLFYVARFDGGLIPELYLA